jgi:membrane associated rhomboid family serine protease
MILPLGDEPNPRGTPLVTYALIAANVAVYVFLTLPLGATPPDPNDPLLREYLQAVAPHLPRGVSVQQILRETSAYDLFVFRHGFRPVDPGLATLFTSMFLHAGFLHLFGNMLFLWIYGDNVEHRLGPPRYLLWYLATGVAATALQTAFSLRSPLPMIGASGAISGVLGFYFILFPHNRVRLLFMIFPFFMNVFTVPARLVLGAYLLLDNLLPFLVARGEGGGVAHGAHIGGFLAGLAVAWFMDRHEITERPAEYRRAQVDPEAGESPGQALASAIRAGRLGEAAQLYFASDPDGHRHLLEPADSLVLGDWLARNGHGEAALTVYRRHLRDHPRGPGTAEAHLGAGLVQLEAGQAASAYQHFLDALDRSPSPETAARARAALQSIAARQKLQIGRPRSPRGS